jgi:hypothetical protein
VATTLKNVGGLITYDDEAGAERVLGYLLWFPEHGAFDACLGKVEVGPGDARTHNALLDDALLDGLDNRCRVGQGGSFYLLGDRRVATWTGKLVSDVVEVRAGEGGKVVVFTRNGMTFRGKVRGDDELLCFRRTS